MGVPGLYAHLTKQYSTPFNHLKNTSSSVPEHLRPDVLLMDGNSMLHPICRAYYFAKPRRTGKSVKPTPKTDQEAYQKISEAVITILQRVQPKKKVVFGIDGSVPFAKSAEQRKRRFMGVSQNVSDPTAFNTAQISVGTPWMQRLHTFLLNAVRGWTLLFPGVEIVYESYLVPGECEHRLVDVIRNGPTEHTYMVHGSDADIISLLLLCWRHYTYILRDRVDGTIDECCVIDIPRLKQCLTSEYLPEIRYRTKSNRELIVNERARINSIVFIWYLVGMDFLPRCPSLEIFNGGMELIAQTMYEVMSKFGSFVINLNNNSDSQEHPEYVINKQALIIWMVTVSKYDNSLIHRKAKAKCLVEDSTLKKYVTIGSDCEVHVDVRGYKDDYNAQKFKNPGDLRKACKNYLDGLQWTFLYYTEGVPSWTWHYPFHYSPWIDDLATTLADHNYSFPKFTRDVSRPFPELLQLLFIVPPQSFHLLPKELRGIKDDYPDMFPESVEIDEEGIQREWEVKSLAPFVDWELMKKEYFRRFPYGFSKKNASLRTVCKIED